MKRLALARIASLIGLLIVAAVAAALLGAVTGGTASETLASSDCRAFTATPTVSPTPTPSPPWVPTHFQIICNDTNQNVNDLHIAIFGSADNLEPVTNGTTGCPSPTFVYGGVALPSYYTDVAVFWSEPCVDVGEYVSVTLQAPCTTQLTPTPPFPSPTATCSVPRINCAYWTYNSLIVTPQATAINPPVCLSPAYTPTPVPTPGPVGGDVELVIPGDSTSASGDTFWALIVLGALSFGAALAIGCRRIRAS